ncbi:hypothetical protein NBRC111894_172 [Sporolactobacillus inulinus]|uniref:Uncharacterized protein n=1 Tax=Sporolactobacillus inulinus TaxID=2078 RepID=A0A4Y1Z6R7_9BACL|nr:hypothetical protein NBRC111894_172 [Sporolactobacillus inulinus]
MLKPLNTPFLENKISQSCLRNQQKTNNTCFSLYVIVIK